MDDALSFFSAHGNRRGMMENRKEGIFPKNTNRSVLFARDEEEDKIFINAWGFAENYLVKGIYI